jgi:nucleoid DNA-binding protein
MLAEYQEIECNRRLINEVAEETDQSNSTIEAMIDHYAKFTAMTIQKGALEGVFFPFLGKFQVKHESQQYKAYLHTLPANVKQFVDTAKMPIDETV